VSGREIRKVSAPDTFSERAKVEPRDVASRFEGVESVDVPGVSRIVVAVSGGVHRDARWCRSAPRSAALVPLDTFLPGKKRSVRSVR